MDAKKLLKRMCRFSVIFSFIFEKDRIKFGKTSFHFGLNQTPGERVAANSMVLGTELDSRANQWFPGPVPPCLRPAT